MPTVARTCNIRFLKQGDPGAPGVAYALRPSVSAVRRAKDGTPSVASFTVTPLKIVGDNAFEEWPSGVVVQCVVRYKIPATGTETSNLLTLSKPDTAHPNANKVTVGDNDIEYTLMLRMQDSATVVVTETVPIVLDGKDGQKGDAGASKLLRGPRVWDKLPIGEQFFDGTATTANPNCIQDIVYHGGYYWLCTASHNRNTEDEPKDGADNWTRFTSWDLVATDVMYAKDAVIDNAVIRNLKTDIPVNSRVEITHDTNDIRIYKRVNATTDRLCTIMSAQTRTFSQLFGGAGGDLSDEGSITSPQITVAFTQPGQSVNDSATVGAFDAGSGVLSGKIRLKVDVTQSLTPDAEQGGDAMSSLKALPHIVVAVKVNGVTVVTTSVSGNLLSMDSPDPVDITGSFSVLSTGGENTITVEVSGNGYSGYTGTWTAAVKVLASDIRVDNTQHRSEFFENGLATGVSTSNYFVAYSQNTGRMAVKVMSAGQNGNARYGFCIFDRLYLCLNGQWYADKLQTVDGQTVLGLTKCNEPNI